MSGTDGNYTLVLAVPAYRTQPGQFAVESAFAEHLRLMKRKLGALARELVMVSPRMRSGDYERQKDVLTVVDEHEEGIFFRPTLPTHVGRLQLLRWILPVMKTMNEAVAQAAIVHAGPSSIYQPFEISSLLLGAIKGKTTVFVADIDHRESSRMNRTNGSWSLKEYWVNRLVHDTARHLQIKFAPSLFSLVLLKGAEMTRDYGRGRANVRNHLDSAYDEAQIIRKERLTARIQRLKEQNVSRRLCYFGRLTRYKGVEHMLRAFKLAQESCPVRLHLDIIGDGPELDSLRSLATSLQLGDTVVFHGALPFGPELFERLYDVDIMLAAPLSQDTPRSALDSMACGHALLAYDTYYYRDLESAGGGVVVSRWGDVRRFADELVHLAASTERLATLSWASYRFAQENTQAKWLEKRIAWTLAAHRQEPELTAQVC